MQINLTCFISDSADVPQAGDAVAAAAEVAKQSIYEEGLLEVDECRELFIDGILGLSSAQLFRTE